MIEEGVNPADSKPWVQPSDRASWRAWLIANHATSSGVHLVTWRRAAGQPTVDYGAAVEEALCVGWVDSKAGKLDADRMTLWFTARRPRSGWSRPNKERVERLVAAGQMLPAGLAVIEEAKQRGTWTLLDDVEDLVVPPDLAAAFVANPPAGANWDAFSRSAKRALLEWIVQAKKPETRAKRIEATATKAARNERANEWVPPDQRTLGGAGLGAPRSRPPAAAVGASPAPQEALAAARATRPRRPQQRARRRRRGRSTSPASKVSQRTCLVMPDALRGRRAGRASPSRAEAEMDVDGLGPEYAK